MFSHQNAGQYSNINISNESFDARSGVFSAVEVDNNFSGYQTFKFLKSNFELANTSDNQ
jgi:hypothetical protein